MRTTMQVFVLEFKVQLQAQAPSWPVGTAVNNSAAAGVQHSSPHWQFMCRSAAITATMLDCGNSCHWQRLQAT
jgi:hypothetical protein